MISGSTRRAWIAASAAAALVLTLGACGGGGGGGGGGDASSIVIDTTFDIKTADPAREYEPTGQIVVKALYDTLLTFAEGDITTPIPDLAASYTYNDDLTEFTFTLAEGRVFNDGSPVTADDVVFSFQRLQGLKGNPSFLVDGITVEKVDDSTVKMTTAESSPALPAILATPSTGIVSQALVTANGGTTDEADAAEDFLNATSAGSGPYIFEKFDMQTEVVLLKNPKYNGPQKPSYERVILRNTEPPTQKMNVERGDSQVALGLSGDQVTSLADGVELESVPSATVVFLFANNNPAISELTANPDTVRAIKAAIDYPGLLEIAGEGAGQATSLIPTQFLGTLPQEEAMTRDLETAKELAAAAGIVGKSITLSFPNDIDPTGLQMTTVAERVQAQLAEADITVDLAPAPFGTEIDAYRNGEEVIGLWYWNPDYLDPANYLAFGPGQTVGLRAGWPEDANAAISDLVAQGYTTGDHDARKALFEEWGRKMNAESPFIPLLQPSSNIAYQPSVTGVSYNPVWLINVAALGAK
ncbi:MAG: ABC transporter substrate-binding protein [Micrococcales bacterium]|nr:ABC transporter substrate-binding protein [Micrococcales bacterium]